MTSLAEILKLPIHPFTKAALEECEGDRAYKWLKAWSAAVADMNMPVQALFWLNDQARKELGYKDEVL